MDTIRHWPNKEIACGIARLAARIGLAGPYTLTPLASGGNNQVLHLAADGQALVLKVYFRHPGDTRDRLRAEYSFLSLVQELGLGVVPRPVARDPKLGLGLYSFIPGRKPLPGEDTCEFVRQALDFFTRLNAGKNHPRAQALTTASEACFSLSEHLDLIAGRVQRLGSITVNDDMDTKAVLFQRKILAPLWEEVRESLHRQASRLKLASTDLLRPEDRCLSPSDFGFHNAIIGEDGKLTFIDFEYAGWDDPAKTACDFFCQPAVPVSTGHLPYVVERLSASVKDGVGLRTRVDLLLPAYRIKWSCIALNEFLPLGRARRRHANQQADDIDKKRRQLAKAVAFAENLNL